MRTDEYYEVINKFKGVNNLDPRIVTEDLDIEKLIRKMREHGAFIDKQIIFLFVDKSYLYKIFPEGINARMIIDDLLINIETTDQLQQNEIINIIPGDDTVSMCPFSGRTFVYRPWIIGVIKLKEAKIE